MKITCNTSKLQKQLQQLKLDVTRKLENMVREFAYHVSLSAIANTPIGNSVTYRKYYEARTDLPQVEGLSKGNWQYGNSPNFSLRKIAGQSAGAAALDNILVAAEGYKLGQKFYIGNATPYIMALENNHSPQTQGQGIMQPTLNTIQGVYSLQLDDYYKRG